MRSEVERFLAVPRVVGSNPHRSQAAEMALLAGTHPLNASVRIVPHVVGGQTPVGRCALALPVDGPDDTSVRGVGLGFFECVDDQDSADELFAWARSVARDHGFAELIGPVDASFWLRYRMKLDHFEDTYVSEPTNPSYYPRLWENAGFALAQRYSTAYYEVPRAHDAVPRYDARRAAALADGARVESLALSRWDEVVTAVHRLTMDLYAPLPLFHPLSLAQFTAIFSPLRRVVDPELVTLVYRGDALIAYSLVVPDYGDLLDRRLTPTTLVRLQRMRRHPARIVSLYMGGAEPRLGSVMSARIIDLARARGQQVIGSLMIEGGVSERLAADHVVQRRHYGLWRLPL